MKRLLQHALVLFIFTVSAAALADDTPDEAYTAAAHAVLTQATGAFAKLFAANPAVASAQ